MDERHGVAQEALGLHLVQHAEVGGHQPVHDPVKVLRAVREIEEHGIDAPPERDRVPEVGAARQQLVRPVVDERPRLGLRLQARPLVRARDPALQPDGQDARRISRAPGPRCGRSSRRRARPSASGSCPRPPRAPAGRRSGGRRWCWRRRPPRSPRASRSRSRRAGAPSGSAAPAPRPCPRACASSGTACAGDRSPGPRLNGSYALVDEVRVARQLVPRELVDGHHGPVGPQPVEALPATDRLPLDGQRRELCDLPRQIPQDRPVTAGPDHGHHLSRTSNAASLRRPKAATVNPRRPPWPQAYHPCAGGISFIRASSRRWPGRSRLLGRRFPHESA